MGTVQTVLQVFIVAFIGFVLGRVLIDEYKKMKQNLKEKQKEETDGKQ
jgi:hypothetical protein